eukprot:1157813-Pelagomonas_calceolata.AAC.7
MQADDAVCDISTSEKNYELGEGECYALAHRKRMMKCGKVRLPSSQALFAHACKRRKKVNGRKEKGNLHACLYMGFEPTG